MDLFAQRFMDSERYNKIGDIISSHLQHREELQESVPVFVETIHLLETCFRKGCKLYLAGNGGSLADCEHIAGELLKGFYSKRSILEPHRSKLGETLGSSLQSGLPVIPLTGFPALRSAVANDLGPDLDFAQLIWALGNPGDVFWGFSTSGNSMNIINAIKAAKVKGLSTIGFTGSSGGQLNEMVDICLLAPSVKTHLIQEFHESAYHAICLTLESLFFEPSA